MFSIGIIDTFGFVTIVVALDTCLKTADVQFVRMDKMSGGIASVVIKGDVAAVTSSVQAGVEVAKALGGYRRHTIIARVDEQTEELLYKGNQNKIKDTHLKSPSVEAKPNNNIEFDMNETEPSLEMVKLAEPLKELKLPENLEIVEQEIQKNDIGKEALLPEQSQNKGKVIEDSIPSDEGKLVTELVNKSSYEKKLQAMTVQELRKIARELNLSTMDKDTIKRARKSDLILNILSENVEREE
ncbi:BMC domain-containing protein [Alkalibaculum sp. M08DMB]|uniref:BMC domain-containing protein n=1 Tax=Alkalibaculum sporogenes TaxID=2655001 RepID=A0A6A7K8K6_9FIRM|nr:BMC domain-containing protein [Alkalibaculum sporogenes]MPW25527.1 BMC domain-containing protein [Alkalibaculum sporogenes]